RIFTHTGRGTLTLKDLSVTWGIVNTPAASVQHGGCIDSTANVKLINVDMSSCIASSNAAANGGAIAASGSVYLKGSRVIDNQATGTNYGGFGGAIMAGDVTLIGSTVADNVLSGSTGLGSVVGGGGIFSHGTVQILSSTISGNSASGGRLNHYNEPTSEAGGLYARGTVTISNSTISANSAAYKGGIDLSGATVSIANSTIAFNHSTNAGSSPAAVGASAQLTLDSDIFSNNTAAGQPSDLSITGAVAPSGGHDLVFSSTSLLPAGALRGECPLLQPLGFNGGAVQTHALWSRSPAIDAGDNASGLPYDERGTGYPRSSAATDIGSFEVQKADEVFGSGFDGC
ncbi:MAG TPA: choice-of-anchor Q domain-containing protein, partial [Rudaea sp.]